MSRVIKFRAWDGSKMWPWEELMYWSAGGELRHYFTTPNLTMLEFTTLKDKHGTDIYEGHIITYFFNGEHKRGAVVFKRGSFVVDDLHLGYLIEGEMAGAVKDKSGKVHTSVEVIGNLYETPDLMREEIAL